MSRGRNWLGIFIYVVLRSYIVDERAVFGA